MSQCRKADHLRICNEMEVEFRDQTTWLEHVRLVHYALSEAALADIDTGTNFMGRQLRAPLMISAISGGLDAAEGLNRDLAAAAQELGIAFCLGSQRPMLDDPSRISSYAVRRYAPDVPILGNIGLQQAAQAGVEAAARLVSDIEADGLAVHLNCAQELSQAEGDKGFPGAFEALKALARRLPRRVMVKETGCGMSREAALRVKAAGVRTLDTAGAGGTSWTRVEHLRSGSSRSWLDEWGIPTAASLWEVSGLGLEIAASGGIRTGLDVAKCLALGASVAGLALPVLRAHARGGYEGVRACLGGVIADLKVAMLLSGAKDLRELRRKKPVIIGELSEWIHSRSRR
jgi:isopentenyl-diphosphate delta-isomerase